MNQYGAVDLLKKLKVKKLKFKDKESNEKLIPKFPILMTDNEFYFCKSIHDYEKRSDEYSWRIVNFNYFYDIDIDAVVIDYLAWSTDKVSVESLTVLYSIVRKDFLEAYGIKLVFGKEDQDDY